MKRDACFRVLAESLPDDIVVATYTSAFEWLAIRPHPLNYVSIGAMGLASSHALGLALALPSHRIVVLDGDGSLLMNLGTLVTVAACGPRNLVHFVCQNGSYEANGGHPIPGLAKLDFAGLAKSAGYRRVETFDDIDVLRAAISDVVNSEGPTLVNLKVQTGQSAPFADYEHIHSAAVREQFRAALQVSIRSQRR